MMGQFCKSLINKDLFGNLDFDIFQKLKTEFQFFLSHILFEKRAKPCEVYFDFMKLLKSSVHILQKVQVLAPFFIHLLLIVMAQYSIKMGPREEN